MLRLGYIGGLGSMAAPGALHLSKGDEARVLAVHDRGTKTRERDEARENWRKHGAKFVPSVKELFSCDTPLDGVIVCAGKNGDDLALVAEAVFQLKQQAVPDSFLLHLSTVSTEFVDSAHAFASEQGVGYANYPLTGGPLGAERGGEHPQGMLILASGDEALYQRLEPMLLRLGRPKYFGSRPSAAAEVKLIGQHMVFNGCVGISSGVALHAAYFQDDRIGGEEQANFFDFLNGGAGGTRQWEVAMRKGVSECEWEAGFFLHHAAVDAIYALDLALKQSLARHSIQAMLHVVLTFSFLLSKQQDGQKFGTQMMARAFLRDLGHELDEFFFAHGAFEMDPILAVEKAVLSLPQAVRDSVALRILPEDFERLAGSGAV